MTKKNQDISKKEITKLFEKLGISKEDTSNENLQDWMKKSDLQKMNEEDVWIVTDSSSSFINFNKK